MTSDPLRDLVRSTTGGDESALQDLVAQCTPRLLAYVRLHMGPHLREREGSVDIVQSVCREVLEDIQSGFEYRNRGAFLRWLFSTALNKIRDRHRYNQQQRRSPQREVAHPALHETMGYANWMTPSREAMAQEDVERLEHAFDQLPSEYQEVITLARIVGMSRAEIAEEMGKTVGSVQMMLGRAMLKLSEIHKQQSSTED